DFVAYLDSRRELAERDREEFEAIGNRDASRLANSWGAFYGAAKQDFVGTYNRDLVGAFRKLQDGGHVEVITSAATHGYLARHGLRYFFVDTHLVAGGTPLGTYSDRFEEQAASETRPQTKASPNEAHALVVRGGKRVAVLARDPRSSVQVWSADYGYPGDGAYLEFHRRRGMDGLRYWRVTDRRLALGEKVAYDSIAAKERADAHADHFAALVVDTLRE